MHKFDYAKPSITCLVQDSGAFGTSDSLIGTFEIDIEVHSFFSKVALYKLLDTLEDQMRSTGVSSEQQKLKNLRQFKSQIVSIITEETTDLTIRDQKLKFLGINSEEDLQKALNPFSLSRTNSRRPNSNLQKIKFPDQDENFGQEGQDESNKLLYSDPDNPFNSNLNTQRDIPLVEKDKSGEEILPVIVMPVFKDKAAKDGKTKGRQSQTESVLEEVDQPILLKYADQYKAIGYDKEGTKGNKHYRLDINCPLKDHPRFFSKTLSQKIEIKKGKAVNTNEEKSLFEMILSSNEVQKTVGEFRGKILVLEKQLLRDIESLGLTNDLYLRGFPGSVKMWESGDAEKDLIREVETTVVVYALDCYMFKDADLFSDNDCYLVLKIGDKVINDSENVIQDRKNPIFNRQFKFDYTFPSNSDLVIEVWDQDTIMDEYMGEIQIDLESRFYNEKFRQQVNLPIEKQTIINKKTNEKVGELKMWVDIFKKNRVEPGLNISAIESKPLKLWEVSSAPSQTMELRVVVYETYDVPNNDPEDMSDIYVQVVADTGTERIIKRTDTHYRSSSGFVRQKILKIYFLGELQLEDGVPN